jgi:sulfite reductase (NADPH) hemoprotein beta-component
VDKGGEEWYQVTIGGRQSGGAGVSGGSSTVRGGGAAIGRIIGPSFARDQIPDVIERLVNTYLAHRDSEVERFVDVVDRLGIDVFKTAVYGDPLPSHASAGRAMRLESTGE